jgi:hypothetical protein
LPPSFLRAIPHADHTDLLALGLVGPQGLAEPTAIMRDHARGSGEDMRGRPVILFELDHHRAREIAIETQYVRHLGAAPRIDRLVIVADAADILALLRDQPQPQILRAVGVLIFVDQHIAEALLIEFEHVAMRLQDRQHVQQQIAEIARIHRAQPRLILRVELARLAVREQFGFAGVDIRGVKPAVLPAIDQPRELARGPAFLVNVRGGEDLLEQAKLIVGI